MYDVEEHEELERQIAVSESMGSAGAVRDHVDTDAAQAAAGEKKDDGEGQNVDGERQNGDGEGEDEDEDDGSGSESNGEEHQDSGVGLIRLQHHRQQQTTKQHPLHHNLLRNLRSPQNVQILQCSLSRPSSSNSTRTLQHVCDITIRGRRGGALLRPEPVIDVTLGRENAVFRTHQTLVLGDTELFFSSTTTTTTETKLGTLVEFHSALGDSGPVPMEMSAPPVKVLLLEIGWSTSVQSPTCGQVDARAGGQAAGVKRRPQDVDGNKDGTTKVHRGSAQNSLQQKRGTGPETV
ncbi:hypothetical protein BJ742DRAFT_874007 [Cladochytrium replicatum]|nr:hypothetical protein BJ742DRAFT_874007 [Cladochytrium replicatum]